MRNPFRDIERACFKHLKTSFKRDGTHLEKLFSPPTFSPKTYKLSFYHYFFGLGLVLLNADNIFDGSLDVELINIFDKFARFELCKPKDVFNIKKK